MSGSGQRPHIESAICLSLNRLFTAGALRPSYETAGRFDWTNGHSGEHMDGLRFRAKLDSDKGTLTLDYLHRDQKGDHAVTCCIGLVTVPCRYGGRRWYFLCPYTGRHALKLYKWPGIELFCHRDAIRPRPTYASQRVSGMGRINVRRRAIRRKLEDSFSRLDHVPIKPKWMRWSTYLNHLKRDSELAAQEGAYWASVLKKLKQLGIDGL